MSALNAKNLNNVPAKLSVATYTSGLLPTYTPGTNDNTVITQIEALFTFTRLASVIDLQISQNLDDNRIKVDADECDIGTILDSSQPNITASATWYESGSIAALNILLGTTILNVAAAPVAVTTEIILATLSGSVTKGAVYIVKNKMGNNTVVGSIVVDVDGAPLVLNTGYAVNVDTTGLITGEIGTTYITFLATTTNDKQVDIDYSYTPNATKYSGVKIESRDIPAVIVKIETCADADGDIDIYYLVNASLTGELLTPFIDVVRAGDLTGSAISFEGQKSGYLVFKKERF